MLCRGKDSTRHFAVIGVALCLLGWLSVACQSPLTTHTGVPLPTATLTPLYGQTPIAAPGSLTDAEAIALIGEELAAREVAPHTAKVTVAGKPRRVSIRYSSSYAVDDRAFRPQTVLVALAAARVVARVHPAVDGGMHLAVVPAGESDVGLRVTVIDRSSLQAWADGSITDQEFVGHWTVWSATRE